MNLIAAVTENWGIGKDGGLLFSIPDDMKFFREKTAGATVIMGRATLESFPGGRPLKNRVNVVLSANPDYSPEGTVVVRSIDEALTEAAKYDEDSVFVIGGAKVYSLLLSYCKYAYITKMSISPEADRFIPDLDEMPQWSVLEESGEREYEGVKYRFVKYVNSEVKSY